MPKAKKSSFGARLLVPIKRLSFDQALFFGLVLALFGTWLVFYTHAAASAGMYGSLETDQLNKLNSLRAGKGVGGLTQIDCLHNIAESWAKQMAANGGISHNLNLANQAAASCGSDWTIVGENVGSVNVSDPYSASDAIFKGFIGSPLHYSNMIDSRYTRVGLGAYIGNDNVLYVVQDFAGCSSCGGAWNAPAVVPDTTISAQTAITDAQGRIEIFGRGFVNGTGVAYVAAQNSAGSKTSWTPFYSLGGNITSSIAAGKNADGRLQIFARGGDNALWTDYQTAVGGSWSGWKSLGGIITSDPTVANSSDGRLQIFARGSNNAVFVVAENSLNSSSSWTPFYSLGGIVTSNIAASKNADGRLQIFGRGGDNALWTKYQTAVGGSWSGWKSLGGIITSDPAIAKNADGRLQVFVVGSDFASYVAAETSLNSSSSWTRFYTLGGLFRSNLTAYVNADGRIQLFGRGIDGALWSLAQSAPSGGFSPWSKIGGLLTSDTAAAVNTDGTMQVFVLGNNNSFYTDFERSASGFFGLGFYQISNNVMAPQPALQTLQN